MKILAPVNVVFKNIFGSFYLWTIIFINVIQHSFFRNGIIVIEEKENLSNVFWKLNFRRKKKKTPNQVT